MKYDFSALEISLVAHDTSFHGLPAYIEVKLDKMPALKDRGGLVLDLGNYIHKTLGLRYQMTPEFRGKGKATTLRWFMSWDDIQPVRENIFKTLGQQMPSYPECVPFEFRSLIIQNVKRGVHPRYAEAS